MTIADRMRTVGSWSGQDVDAEAIQSQLTKLWRASVERARHNGQPAAARTNVLTLVVYAADDATLARSSDAVSALVAHHPSRTILVRAEPGVGEPSLAADVVTRCRIDRPQVCHEQIELRAHGARDEQVSSAVASLLLRDLPTYLWWPHDILGQSALLSQLRELCDGVIVDSGAFADPPASLATLLSLLSNQRLVELADLQWERLTRWRDITAQFFDGAATRPFLDGLAAVTVQVSGSPPTTRWPALLYAGWLASRLGWTLPAGAALLNLDQFTLRAGDRQVAVAISATTPGNATAGTLASVQLQARHDERPATFTVERGADDQVTTRVVMGDMAPVERTMSAPAPTDAALLSQTLGYFRRDRVYTATLRWISTLLGAESANNR